MSHVPPSAAAPLSGTCPVSHESLPARTSSFLLHKYLYIGKNFFPCREFSGCPVSRALLPSRHYLFSVSRCPTPAAMIQIVQYIYKDNYIPNLEYSSPYKMPGRVSTGSQDQEKSIIIYSTAIYIQNLRL